MKKTASLQQLKKLVNDIHTQKKTIILVGGVFDIIHIGHIRFLKQAQKLGNILIVLLENNKKVKKIKGKKRPIHTQKERAEMLATLSCVDYIVLLPFMSADSDYEKLTQKINPCVIAFTQGDLYEAQKIKQARKINARIVEIPKIQTPSTTQLAKLLELEK